MPFDKELAPFYMKNVFNHTRDFGYGRIITQFSEITARAVFAFTRPYLRNDN